MYYLTAETALWVYCAANAAFSYFRALLNLSLYLGLDLLIC